MKNPAQEIPLPGFFIWRVAIKLGSQMGIN
jgi:hypothetical protein